MRRVAAAVMVAASFLAYSGESAPAAGEQMKVNRARMRFSRPNRDGFVKGSVTVEGDYLANGDGYDPDRDALCVVLGPCGLLRSRDMQAPVLGRRGRDGYWTIVSKRPYGKGSSLKLRFQPDSGDFTVRAKGLDFTPLSRAEPDTFPLTLRAGTDVRQAAVEFEGIAGRKWDYQADPNLITPPPMTSTPGENPALQRPNDQPWWEDTGTDYWDRNWEQVRVGE